MALARLVVSGGPDQGKSFDIPLRGGAIGRGPENVVALTDPSVSRCHCRLELRDGQLAVVDVGSRNRTLVNGSPVSVHVLQVGDEIIVGQTRLSFVTTLEVPTTHRPSRVSIEVDSKELLLAETRGLPVADRAQRHLSALADFGKLLRTVADHRSIANAACQAALLALNAQRALVVRQDADGAPMVTAAAFAAAVSDAAQRALPVDMIERALGKTVALAADEVSIDNELRAALVAPLVHSRSVLYADRASPPWQRIDLMALGCLAQLLDGGHAQLRARDMLVEENRELIDQLGGRQFIGNSALARQVMDFVYKVGPTDATVLLTGESGSGKEMVARALHESSRRADGPFIAVNCAALTETLVESELFGHEKGAFTGASERKIGRFEAAHQGTLFLDEVGELPLQCQTKFLRVLEERSFDRVGGTQPISVDVRVIAATNRELQAMVGRGQFRDDLFYRLSVIHNQVPPLRERREDIGILAQHFLERLRHQVPRKIRGFDERALAALQAYPWPGNVRELRNAVERAIVLGGGELILREDLPPEVAAGARPAAPAPMRPSQSINTPAPVAPKSLKQLERDGIVAALAATSGNKARAAAMLEIDRSTLYKKLKDYGIEP